MSEINLGRQASIIMKGTLYKKGSSVFAGWQGRIFYLLADDSFVYSEEPKGTKETRKEIYGFIPLNKAQKVEKKTDLIFELQTTERNYELKSDNDENFNKWVYYLNAAIQNISKKPKKNNEESEEGKKDKKGEKDMSSLDFTTIDQIKAAGLILSGNDEVANKELKERKIDTLLNLAENKNYIKTYYDVTGKHSHSGAGTEKKVFVFLFSHRSLRKEYLIEDEENSIEQKDWVKYDTLYTFELETSKKKEIQIDMLNCKNLTLGEKEDNYFLIVDDGKEQYKFCYKIKGQRDLFYEVLTTSQETAIMFNKSITKNPRNVYKLEKMLIEDGKTSKNEYSKKIQAEIYRRVGKVEDINDFNTLNTKLDSLQEYLEFNVDGIICHPQFNDKLLNTYLGIIYPKYLDALNIFWTKNYSTLEDKDILSLATRLYALKNKLNNSYHLQEDNISQSANELGDIIMKKTYINLIEQIENIIKKEKESKAISDENNKFKTEGPKEVFELLNNKFNEFKDTKTKEIYLKVMELFSKIILQYIIGIDSTFIKNDLIIESNFYIGLANNTFNFKTLLNEFINSVVSSGIVNENEIKDTLRYNQINNSLDRLNHKLIYRFVELSSKTLETVYQNKGIKDLDAVEISESIYGIFEDFLPGMLDSTKEKYWEEVLNLSLFLYVQYLILNNFDKNIPIEELSSKIQYDKEVFVNYLFEDQMGKQKANKSFQVFDDICEYIKANMDLISYNCVSLRNSIGDVFEFNFAKALLLFKFNFSQEDKKNALMKFKEVLQNEDPKITHHKDFFENMKTVLQSNESISNAIKEIDDNENEIPNQGECIGKTQLKEIIEKETEYKKEEEKKDSSIIHYSTIKDKNLKDLFNLEDFKNGFKDFDISVDSIENDFFKLKRKELNKDKLNNIKKPEVPQPKKEEPPQAIIEEPKEEPKPMIIEEPKEEIKEEPIVPEVKEIIKSSPKEETIEKEDLKEIIEDDNLKSQLLPETKEEKKENKPPALRSKNPPSITSETNTSQSSIKKETPKEEEAPMEQFNVMQPKQKKKINEIEDVDVDLENLSCWEKCLLKLFGPSKPTDQKKESLNP
ncbi:MAG: PH domain-containing protein [archaeon]|nr:PH domain-containing protein [archaeon]